jgi:hypothetical protein
MSNGRHRQGLFLWLAADQKKPIKSDINHDNIVLQDNLNHHDLPQEEKCPSPLRRICRREFTKTFPTACMSVSFAQTKLSAHQRFGRVLSVSKIIISPKEGDSKLIQKIKAGPSLTSIAFKSGIPTMPKRETRGMAGASKL